MSFRRRDYPEVLETMLTALAGGVAAEAHPYLPSGNDSRMALESPPARVLVSVHGARNGASHRFKTGNDVALSADGTEFKAQVQERELAKIDLKSSETVYLGWATNSAHVLGADI